MVRTYQENGAGKVTETGNGEESGGKEAYGGECSWVLRHSLSQLISVAFNIERKKSYKFFSEALISA